MLAKIVCKENQYKFEKHLYKYICNMTINHSNWFMLFLGVKIIEENHIIQSIIYKSNITLFRKRNNTRGLFHATNEKSKNLQQIDQLIKQHHTQRRRTVLMTYSIHIQIYANKY